MAETSEHPDSVKLSEMKLALCVSDHVPECHKTREGLDRPWKKLLDESKYHLNMYLNMCLGLKW